VRRGQPFGVLSVAVALTLFGAGGVASEEPPVGPSGEPVPARMELLLAPAVPVADPAAIDPDGLTAGSWMSVRSSEEALFPVLPGILRGEPLPGVPLASFHLEPGTEQVIDLGAKAEAGER